MKRRKTENSEDRRNQSGSDSNQLLAVGYKRKIKHRLVFAMMLLTGILLTGCSNQNTDGTENTTGAAGSEATAEANAPTTGIAYESAKDAEIDFAVLQEENSDIFGWLYVPDTNIDAPILQSEEADDYYETHDAYGAESSEGALYTELANLKNMCDFNTVIHGRSDSENAPFAQLNKYADPDFFEEHENIYLYIDGNLLTYSVFASYEREDTSLIRIYDFTYASGCQQFLDDLYSTRSMTMNLREGWEEVTPYHFLITLTTHSQSDPEKQFVVVAALVGDAAGTIDRIIE